MQYIKVIEDYIDSGLSYIKSTNSNQIYSFLKEWF